MPAYYKVSVKGKYEGFNIYQTAIAKTEEVLKDSFLSQCEITNVELLFDSPDSDDILEPIADLLNQISGLGLAGRDMLRNDALEYCELTWGRIEAIRALTDIVEEHLERLKLFVDCLEGWETDATEGRPNLLRERLTRSPLLEKSKEEAS